MVECAHGKTAPLSVVKGLSECQAGTGRHKCAVCAYDAGKQAGLGHSISGPSEECDQNHAEAPLAMLRALPSSQAGPHRHKCAYEAYQAGRAAGQAVATSASVNVAGANLGGEESANRDNDLIEEQQIVTLLNDADLKQTQKEQLVLARRGQGEFRRNVAKINGRCWLTGIDDPSMLIASHIKPWRSSSNQERLDGYNGMMLAPHVDHLFDKGWITFDNSGKLLLSSKLKKEILDKWGIHNNKCLGVIEQRHLPYLDYHRRNVFKI